MNVVIFCKLLLLVGVHGSKFPQTNSRRTYDFIVVGAGSAGAVVASRLTENSNVNVLLLEAGITNITLHHDSEIPVYCYRLLKTSYDWDYQSEPQVNACFGLQERRNKYPRGKTLGGTSAINLMMYVRGNKKDFDGWAAMGNQGWSFNDVLPYFKKSEDNRDAVIASNSKYHSTGGYLTVSSIPPQPGSGAIDAFVKSGKRANLNNNDVNGERQTGIMIMQTTTRDGLRCSTEKAFLQPAAKRPNLTIIQNAYVTKILINNNKQAYGVIYETSRRAHQVFAKKEVIVSCGSINTPQLLLLSGIGATEQLNKFRIPVVADVKGVGENFHDHPTSMGMFWTLQRSIALTIERLRLLMGFIKWLFMGRGIPTRINVEAVLFLQTKYESEPDWPDVEAQMSDVSLVTPAIQTTLGLTSEGYNRILAPLQNESTLHLTTFLLRPKSRGSVRLNSADPYENPLIDPRFFTHPDDITVLAEGMRQVVEFGQSPEFEQLGAQYYAPTIPGCEDVLPLSLEYYKCSARYLTQPGSHPVGTSKMGPLDSDPMAVVGPDLRVRGVSGLRVIDASIMPIIVSGNTNAASIMIGEKGSDLVKETWML